MSLNVLNIPSALAEQWEPYTNAENRSMVYATMAVGWGEITEENHVQWFIRLRAWELAVGPFQRVMDDDELVPKYFTLEDVKRYIGLQTNVFGKEPDFVFAQKILGVFTDRARYWLLEQGIDCRDRGSDQLTDEWAVTVQCYEPDDQDDDDDRVSLGSFKVELFHGSRSEAHWDPVAPGSLEYILREVSDIIDN